MERRLLGFIMTPAMIASWFLGVVLVLQGQWLAAPWFHVKFALVLAMTALHGFFARWVNDFARDRNTRSPKFYRIVNEIPTVLLILIVLLAVVKPF
jgi:putative membrane protein